MRRLPLALLPLAFLAAGCSERTERYPCPGSPVATLTFVGTRRPMDCPGADPAWTNSLFPATLEKFTATISASTTGTTAAAFCLDRTRAEPLVGTLVSDTLDVALDTRGGVLSMCSSRCAVTVHQQVTGTLQRAPGGAPIGFTGTLVDQATLDAAVVGADCAPCTTPCQASYDLVSPPPPGP